MSSVCCGKRGIKHSRVSCCGKIGWKQLTEHNHTTLMLIIFVLKPTQLRFISILAKMLIQNDSVTQESFECPFNVKNVRISENSHF